MSSVLTFASAVRGLALSLPLSLALSVLTATPAAAQGGSTSTARDYTLRVTTVTEGLEHPWGLAFLPDGRMLVTERPGRLRVVGKDGKLDPSPVAGLPRVDAQGQGGLLDVVLHPQFASNGWIYWSYAQRDEAGNNGTEVARGKLSGQPGAYRMTDVQVVFRMGPKSNRGHHFGSRIVFDRQGLMYVTLGDRGEMQRAQRMDDHAGKILRLTDEGKPAPGNPYEKQAGARPEIFSLGNRNVQGAALHPKTGALWAVEHGPQGGDELNLIKAGTNYGWPVITYGANYVTGTKIGEGTEKAGLVQPVRQWTPSPAVSGMAFYDNANGPFAKWQGDALIGALRGQGVIRVRLGGDNGEQFVEEERLLTNVVGRVRDVRVGPDGLIYLLTDQPNGALVRVQPAR